MEVYNVPEHGHADAYLIQGSEPNSYLTSQLIEQFEAMYNEGAPELAVQQGLYYPTATNYGYICTGLESPGNWDDHQRFFGLDGQEIQYPGAQTDGVPYLYCYGYSESPYNPYNPYIPGAMIGVDGTYAGSEQYYSIPSYENAVSSPAYYPMVVQTTPDILSSSNGGPFNNTSASLTNRADGPGLKHNLSSASAAYTLNPSRIASNRTSSFTRGSEGSKVSAGPSKQHVAHGSVTSSGSSNGTSHVFQGRGTRAVNDVSHGKVWSNRNQVKVTLPSGNGLSSFGSSAQGRPVMDKAGTKIHAGRASDDVNGSPDALSEQNRGPRINKSKNQLCVKAYTNRAGDSDAQGNIIIYPDQYNKDDFPVDYVNAKFFVIKSYSEDDVHKSIKYNVWSSTTNGNRKLNIAYDDTQKIAGGEPGGCPIFLFFSVNASGQYCGVAEMTGPVDFHKDMDFWQQDKWCGSFPVKWHIIKDVPNPSVRHIILENNENKPVTNSRDTQEIKYKKGMEMLKVFKNHMSKTSLLDDFMYYENRQKLLQEEKARLLIKTYGNNPYFIPLVVEPPRKLNDVMDLPPNEDEKITKHDDISSSGKNASTSTEQVLLDKKVNSSNIAGENGKFIATDEKAEDVGTLKIGSLSVNPKPVGVKPADGSPTNAQGTSLAKATVVNTEPIEVNGFAKSAGGFLTIGTIPLKLDESGNKKG